MITRPTLTELVDQMRLDVEGAMRSAIAWVRHRVLDVLVRVYAAALHALYGTVLAVARQLFPMTADEDYLELHASTWDVARNAATAASGAITITGTNGAVLAAGALLARIDGAQFATTAEAIIADGEASVAVEAVEPGAAGNSIAGTQLTAITAAAGVNAVATVEAGGLAGGNAIETVEAWRARILTRIRTRGRVGTAADYESWALDVPGVTRVWIKPQWLGIGTLGIFFVMDGRENIFPLSGDVTIVQAAIDAHRPVTAEATVIAPIAQTLPIEISAAPATTAVRAAIVAEITDLFLRKAEPGGTMRLSWINEAISVASGEDYHDLADPTDDVTADPGHILVPEVTFP